MGTLTLRLNEEEEKIFNAVASMYGGKVSTAIKQLALEKIEEDYDRELISNFEKREVSNEVELVSLEDMKKALGL